MEVGVIFDGADKSEFGPIAGDIEIDRFSRAVIRDELVCGTEAAGGRFETLNNGLVVIP